ncbi:MAG: DUF177 domain-containing protein [Acidimicrobiia bacterium]
MNGLRFDVAQLVGKPGERRHVEGKLDLDLSVGSSSVAGPVTVAGVVDGIADGVMVRLEIRAPVHLVCTRCLAEWDEDLEISAVQVFEPEPDEDGYALERDDFIDLSGPVRDEVALAIPIRPLCRPDCLGLCPTCGTDLNREPCGGHEEPSRSPFAALQGLFDTDSDRTYSDH